MGTAHTRFKHTKIFGSLDGLRCLSILAVILFHATSPHAPGSPLANLGAAGVGLFFTISGFLITTLLLREQQRFGRIDLGAFYARRSLRIFPLYYTVLSLYVVAVWLLERDPGVRKEFFDNLPAFASYTSNWFVDASTDRVVFFFAWSLATEEQFYLFWPSVEKYARRAAPYLMVVLLVFVELVWTEVIPTDPNGLFHRIVLSFAPGIGCGVLLAHLLHQERSFALVQRALTARVAAPLALAATVACVLLQAPTLVTSLVMAALVGACCVREDNALAPVLQFRPVARLGAVSYGMYLMHMLFLNLAKRVCERIGIHSHGVQFGLALALVFGVAWLSYNTYEAQFLKLKAKFTRGEQPKPRYRRGDLANAE